MKISFKSNEGPNLYKRDSDGRTRLWKMVWDDQRRYRTVSGLIDGKLTETEWTTPVPKRQKTVKSQGEAEILAKYTHQLKREYHATQDDLDTPNFTDPMLAKPYVKWPGPGYQQPKLDGIRCIAKISGLFSRQGQPIVAVPHIAAACASLFEQFPRLVLDGELYNHQLHDDFGKIVSIVRKQKCTTEDLELSAAIMQYHVYDIVDPALVFSQRLEMLRSLTESSPAFIHVVATTKCDSQKNADEAYGAFLAANYEGGIYRLDKLYEAGKRSSSLLKRKDFMDGEFSVVSISEGSGNWAGSAKHMTLRKPDGVTFGAGIRGSYKQNVKLLKTAINEKTTATVRYFQLTADGIPRFGVVTDFHVSGRQD